MKKTLLQSLFLLSGILIKSQIGINNTNPKASLHLDAKNKILPESTVGLGVPVVDKFPTASPSSNQDGMLIYLRNTTDSNLEGFYYWDHAKSNWEYIMDLKAAGLDVSKTIASGNSFSPNNMSGNGVQSRTIPLTTINSLDPSFSLSNGGLKIGKTATYYIFLTGGVYKDAVNNVNEYITEILINGVSNTQLTSTNTAPGGDTVGRSSTFYIATIFSLNKDDVLTVKTTRTTTAANTVSVDTPYTLTIINLN
ncbi:hypothetical protein [Chryseobacterium sp. C3]|uniref:hypothetical protein n=1 Tax=Chryseobacterium sp. C3 TaxID=2761532 RepID=UPI0016260E79|nr:hypothetical protein [Chryseobacterium sp. C3]